jgi:hypothetical protein
MPERKAMPTITAMPIKADRLTSTKWRVLAIPFGGPFKGKDLDGEFFSPRTDIKPDWFDKRPVIFHHGQDANAKDMVLGVEDDLEMEPDGWWGTMWMDRQNRYFSFIDKLMQQGKAFGSSGSIGHLVRKDRKTGELLTWPHAEQTVTPTPINVYSVVTASKAFDDFSSAGITVDEDTRGLFTEPDQTPDLGPTLPQGGKDPAAARLVVARIRVDAMLRRLDD